MSSRIVAGERVQTLAAQANRHPPELRAYDRFGGNIGCRAWTVLDDERLAKTLRKPLADETRNNVNSAACSIADDPAHWTPGGSLRSRDPGDDWHYGGARGKMQKLSAGKFHKSLSASQRTPLGCSKREDEAEKPPIAAGCPLQ